LVEQFEPLDDHEFELWLEKLIDHVQNQRLSSNVVELKAIELAVKVNESSKTTTHDGEIKIGYLFSSLSRTVPTNSSNHQKMFSALSVPSTSLDSSSTLT
jgi:DNA polymerases epsilon N terminal